MKTGNAHFLHIGKCAGTTIKNFLNKYEDDFTFNIHAHPHTVKFNHLPKSEPYFFSVRNPLDRFYSGFYSRKRKGAPRIYAEWSASEKRAFERFEDANDLAEALFSNTSKGIEAFDAMNSIGHIRNPQHTWFSSLHHTLSKHPPLCVLRQEFLDIDIQILGRRLGGSRQSYDCSGDDVQLHRNNYEGKPNLSELAKDNLKKWYASDLYFYAVINDWIEKNQNQSLSEKDY